MDRNYDDTVSDPRTGSLTLTHEDHDNGYVEGCDECAQDELEAEELRDAETWDEIVAEQKADERVRLMVDLFTLTSGPKS